MPRDATLTRESPQDIARAAEVSDDDVTHAAETADQDCTPLVKRLLDATLDTQERRR